MTDAETATERDAEAELDTQLSVEDVEDVSEDEATADAGAEEGEVLEDRLVAEGRSPVTIWKSCWTCWTLTATSIWTSKAAALW